MSLMATALVLAWVAIVLLTLSVAGLMRQVHMLLTERSAEADAARTTARSPALPAGLVTEGADGVLLFASTSCVACSEVMPTLVEYCTGGDRSCTVITAAARHPAWPDTLVYRENAADLFERFAVVATPHALRIVDGAIVGSAPVGSAEALRRLLDGPRHELETAG